MNETGAASAVFVSSTSTTAAWKLAARSATGNVAGSFPNSRTWRNTAVFSPLKLKLKRCSAWMA